MPIEHPRPAWLRSLSPLPLYLTLSRSLSVSRSLYVVITIETYVYIGGSSVYYVSFYRVYVGHVAHGAAVLPTFFFPSKASLFSHTSLNFSNTRGTWYVSYDAGHRESSFLFSFSDVLEQTEFDVRFTRARTHERVA